MRDERRLIVNADDFGQTHSINRGVIDAHERGIVTSASLMVRRRPTAAAEAAVYARAHPELSVGLHFDLYEMFYNKETWQWEYLYRVVSPDDPEAVAGEFSAQLDAFRRLLGRDPSHLDSHQHVHRSNEAVRAIMLKAAGEIGVPLRDFCQEVSYSGEFYGQTGKGYACPEGISVNALLQIIGDLPLGVTELGCHPGYSEDLEGMYQLERAEEVRTLCDPRVREVLAAEGVALCSFHDLAVEIRLSS